MTDPVPVRIPRPFAEVQFAVEALFSVRLPLMATNPLRLNGPLTVVTPAPVIRPPDQLNVPFVVSVPVPASVPARNVKVVAAGMATAVLTFRVPLLLSRTVPGPVTVVPALRSKTPAANSSVADAPETVSAALLLPLAPRLSVPLWTSTVPVLVNRMVIDEVPVPADFLKVPELLNVVAPP